MNVLFESSNDLSCFQNVKVESGSELNVTCKLLVGFVVSVIEWATFELDHTGESLHIIDGSCSSNFGTKTVTTDSSHSDFVLVHESDNIL